MFSGLKKCQMSVTLTLKTVVDERYMRVGANHVTSRHPNFVVDTPHLLMVSFSLDFMMPHDRLHSQFIKPRPPHWFELQFFFSPARSAMSS